MFVADNELTQHYFVQFGLAQSARQLKEAISKTGGEPILWQASRNISMRTVLYFSGHLSRDNVMIMALSVDYVV